MDPDCQQTVPMDSVDALMAAETRIVPADVAEQVSPKRQRGAASSSLTVPDNFWEQVQNTVSLAVTASLSPLQQAVTSLQERTAATDHHVQDLDTRFRKQNDQLEELDLRMAKHFSSLEAQVQGIQKELLSPQTSPPASPSAQKACDIVLGGWQVGEAREWIEEEVQKLLRNAGVQEYIQEARPLGNRRPKCLKLVLRHSAASDMSSRRELQSKVISAVNSCNWVPRGASKAIWIKPDRTLQERSIAKAYAILYQFVENQLGMDKAKLEVESWINLEVWVGRSRVLGNAIGPYASPPPRAGTSIVWVVQEQQHNLSVWLDVQSLAEGYGLPVADVLQKWRSK